MKHNKYNDKYNSKSYNTEAKDENTPETHFSHFVNILYFKYHFNRADNDVDRASASEYQKDINRFRESRGKGKKISKRDREIAEGKW